MPPRRTSPLTPSIPVSADWFVVRITDDADAPEYQWVEVLDQGDGALTELVGGRYGGPENPGIAVLGNTFEVGDFALCRSAAGRGGLTWELYPIGGGDGTGSGGSGSGAGGCGWVAGLVAGDCIEARIIGASGRCDCEDALTGGSVVLTSANGLTWTIPVPEEGQQETLTVCGAPFLVAFTKGDCNGPCLVLATPSVEDAGEGIEACGPGVFYGVSGTVSLSCPVYDLPTSIERQGDSPIWIGAADGKTFKILCDGDTWVGSIESSGLEVIGTYSGEISNAQSIEYNFLFNFFGCPGNQLVVTFTLPKVTGGGGGSGGVSYLATRESCDTNHAIFSVGGALCSGPKGCGGPAGNTVRVRVSWLRTCSWDGPGWYCVRDCGATGRGTPVELFDDDLYDGTIEIVSGPYATSEEAFVRCGPNIRDVSPTGCSYPEPLPRRLRFTAPTNESSDACIRAFSGQSTALFWSDADQQWAGELVVTAVGGSQTCQWVIRMHPCRNSGCATGTGFHLSGFYPFAGGGGDNMGCSDGSESAPYTVKCDAGTLTLNPFHCEFTTGCDYTGQPYTVDEG